MGYAFAIGNFYFYDNFVITELYDNANTGYESLNEFIHLMNDHFGDTKPYGLISNRKNSYSLELLSESKDLQKILSNRSTTK